MADLLFHCVRCACVRPHKHMHCTAHGIAETHMQGSEHFVCTVCSATTFSRDDNAARFSFQLDKVLQ